MPNENERMDSFFTSSDNSTSTIAPEYNLEMQPISKKREKSLCQIWFFRYDCIVNQAYPDIALHRNENNQLVACPFDGSSTQKLNPAVINATTETYVIESGDSNMVLSLDLMFRENASESSVNVPIQWQLTGTKSTLV